MPRYPRNVRVGEWGLERRAESAAQTAQTTEREYTTTRQVQQYQQVHVLSTAKRLDERGSASDASANTAEANEKVVRYMSFIMLMWVLGDMIILGQKTKVILHLWLPVHVRYKKGEVYAMSNARTTIKHWLQVLWGEDGNNNNNMILILLTFDMIWGLDRLG